jgi:serine/threonine-protein kinase
MGFATASVLAPLLLIGVFEATGGRRHPVDVPDLGATGSPAQTAAASTAVAPTASLAGPIVAPAASATVEPAPAPTEIAGRDATAWRKALRSSAETNDWKTAAEALDALAKLDPDALDDDALAKSSVSVAVAVGNFAPDLAPRAFEALGATPGGIDVLYSVMSTRGGTKAAQQATELLDKVEVASRASAALRVTLELRKAPCKEKESLFDRAVADGDTRTLVLMEALRSPKCTPEADGCCLRDNGALESATRKLRARVAPGTPSPAAGPTMAPATTAAVGSPPAAPPPAPKPPPQPASGDPY